MRGATSFSSVDVIAEIEDTVDIEIDPSEIRMDVYRASGKGGNMSTERNLQSA